MPLLTSVFFLFKNPDYQLMPSDLEAWEEKHGKIPDDVILLVFYDWGKHWPDKKKYLGTDTKNTSLLHFPGKGLQKVNGGMGGGGGRGVGCGVFLQALFASPSLSPVSARPFSFAVFQFRRIFPLGSLFSGCICSVF